jgi:hypothetical protein
MKTMMYGFTSKCIIKLHNRWRSVVQFIILKGTCIRGHIFLDTDTAVK